MQSLPVEALLSHLRCSQLAMVWVMIDNSRELADGIPDDLVRGPALESEELLRRIEAYAHSDNRYDFHKSLVPAARRALKMVGFQ